MSRFTDDELEALLRQPETDRAERKESFKGSAPETVREAVCAFANDLPNHRIAGVVFIGVKDNGDPTDLNVSDELLRQLADIKTDGNILPPPTIFVEKRTLLGRDVAVITVEPSDSPPVRYKGRIFIRIGPRKGIATAQDERILNEKRRYRDLPFDINPVPSSKLTDLSRTYFEEVYLPSAVARDVLEANGRSYEQRLAATKMIAAADDPTPTVLGLLILGNRPQDFIPGAYVQFLRIRGTELGDEIVDEKQSNGRLAEVIAVVEEKFKSHNRVSVSFSASETEKRQDHYPIAALQQLFRNAVMHRTYESTNAPVRVYWFDNRIEIHSPGGPFGVVTKVNFGMPGVTDYRNPNLAEALKTLGFLQRFGVGIATARRLLHQNGNPEPKVEIGQSGIVWVIEVAS